MPHDLIEVSAYLGSGGQVVQTFIEAATRSSMQVVVPFLLAGHRLAKETTQNQNQLLEEWNILHEQAQAAMATNAPACAASLDQGKSLARVAQQWLTSNHQDAEHAQDVLKCLEHGTHVGPVLGATAALLGLTEVQACRLFGYCVARDIISAAVRLSLVGPLASVPMLSQVQEAAEDGWNLSRRAMEEHQQDPLAAAAACAPVIEALHPCHDILQVRLFRT